MNIVKHIAFTVVFIAALGLATLVYSAEDAAAPGAAKPAEKAAKIDLEPRSISPDMRSAQSIAGLSRGDIPHGRAANMLGSKMIPIPADSPFEWQFKFYFEKPRPIKFQIPTENKPRIFWFLKFAVINKTGKDRLFNPEFILYTDTGQMLRANEGFESGSVFKKIKRVVNNPLLLDISDATGKLLQGEDNGKESVAIFQDFDPKAGGFEIFVGGLSGETIKFKLPKPIEIIKENPVDPKGATKEQEKITTDIIHLTKTLKLTYKFGNEARDRKGTDLRYVGKEWIMR